MKTIKEIKQAAIKEFSEGGSRFSEIYMDDFVAWYIYIKSHPTEVGLLPENADQFDVESMKGFFEEWAWKPSL